MAKYLDESGLRKFAQVVKLAFTKNVSYDSSTRKLRQTRYVLNGTTIEESTSDLVQLSTVATSGSYNDLSNKPTIPSGVSPYDSNPAMDGTASPGSSTLFSRGDHVHPTDTSRAASSHAHGNITNNGDITATAPTVASGDKIIINDESASKITNGPSFGTDTTKYLRNDGSWSVPAGPSDFTGATSNAAGAHGLVPAPASGEQTKIILGDGDWHKPGLYWVQSLGNEEPYGDTLQLFLGTEQLTPGGPVDYITDGMLLPLASDIYPGLMSTTAWNKLANIAAGAEVNVQSDWNQTTTTADDYIKNKPGDFTGSVNGAAGVHGLVPAPLAKQGYNPKPYMLFDDGAWHGTWLEWTFENNDYHLKWMYSDGTSNIAMSDLVIGVASANGRGLMSSTDWSKLDGIAAGAEVNVQSDWNQTTTTADDYIKNKPTLGTAAAKNVGSVANGNTGLVTGDAVYDAIQASIVDVVGYLVYKGTVSAASGMTSFKKGWSWIASAAFTIGSGSSAKSVEVGDMLIANADGASASTSNIDVIQTNIDTLTTAEVEAIWNAA